MTLRITRRRSSGPAAALGHGGFTLVELLLVMALLAIVMAFAAPNLAPFFRGRTLDGEARRVLALTRHGQGRAVSEGIPMMLWLDASQGTYGLEQEPGWDDKDPKAVEFKLDRELKMTVVNTNTTPQRFNPVQLRPAVQSEAQKRNLPEIRFLPDGTIDETSPQELRIQDREGISVSVLLTTNRLNYEIQAPRQE